MVFIRYNDPDFHVRIRFHLPDPVYQGWVIQKINEVLRPYVDEDIIYKIQTDTYIRELERYGANNIVSSESLFYKESELLLDAIELIEDHNLYFFFILKVINQLLDSFQYTLEEKLHLASINQEAFKREFVAGKPLTKQLDKKYRGLKDDLAVFLSTKDTNEEYKILNQILLKNKGTSLEEINHITAFLKNTGEIKKDSLISSYIHMLVNRAFRSKQRFYELVCYDFLSKYYLMIIRRKE